MKIWKWTTFGSAVILLLCLAGLLFTDVSFRYQPELISFPSSDSSESPDSFKTADYYPGQGETAFLLAANETGTADKTILSCLLQAGFPVMVTRPEAGDADEVRTLEAQAALLSEKTGLPESRLILIGFHSGGTALLDEIINGTHSYQALALISPLISTHRIDEGTIVNGNYRNESEWINALSPEMLRQPTILISSNGDDRTTPYSMTLIYNKLSGDQIIHVGGVYQASRDQISLSILDGGFHSNSPYQMVVLKELFSFLNQQDSGLSLSVGLLPTGRSILRFGLAASLFVLLICFSYLVKYRLSDVSYGVPSSIKLEKPARFFLAKGLSWLVALPVSILFFFLYQVFTGQAPGTLFLITIILFAFSGSSLVMGKWFKLPGVGFFRPVAFKPSRVLLSLCYWGGATAALLVYPFSGYTFSIPQSGAWWEILLSILMAFLWFRLFLVEEEQIKDYKSGLATKITYYFILVLPLLFFALCYAIFVGNSAALACGIVLALLAGTALLGNGLFQLSGSAAVSALLCSSSFVLLGTLLASF